MAANGSAGRGRVAVLVGMLILVAVAVWGVMAVMRAPGPEGDLHTTEEPLPAPPPAAGPPLPAAAPDGVRFDGARTFADLAEAIRRLSTNIESVIVREGGHEALAADYKAYERRAERVVQDREALEDAVRVSEVLLDATRLIREVHRTHFPARERVEGHLDEAEAAARALDPGGPVSHQETAVVRYFQSVSAALRLMGPEDRRHLD